MTRQTHILIGLLIPILLTSCGHLANFVVENKTQKDVVIELVYDTNYVSDLIGQYRLEKYNAPLTKLQADSIKQSYRQPEILFKYLCDSLTMGRLVNLKIFGIGNISKVEPSNCTYCTDLTNCVDFRQTVASYYNSDSTLIKKIINDNTITLFLPSNYSFFNRCHSCGDCSCEIDEAFPAEEVKVKIDNKDFIILTRDNYKHIMTKKTFDSMKESIVLELN